MAFQPHVPIVQRYERFLKLYGDTPMGVEWKNQEDAEVRYKVMYELTKGLGGSLLDFGCGTARFLDYLIENKLYNFDSYTGVDLSDNFLAVCCQKYPHKLFLNLNIQETVFPTDYDFVVMNGVFTVRETLSYAEMYDYLADVVFKTWQQTKKGLAFNVMSKAVDWEKSHLFHVPLDDIEKFVTSLTRKYQVRHDYGLYEYTVYCYK